MSANRYTTWAVMGLFGAAGALAAASGCVGDEPSTPGDTTADSGSGDAASTDGSSQDGGSDSGPSCLPPTSASPGTLDPTFGTSFKAITKNFVPLAFTIDGTGRAYVAGQASNCATATSLDDYAVVRFTASGDVDAAFNPGFMPRCYDFGTGGVAAQAIAIDPDGKIVIGGFGGGSSGTYFAGVVRIDDTGALDTTFNGTGMLLGVYAGSAFAVKSGKFVSVNGIGFFGDKIVLTGADDSIPGHRTTGFVSRLNHDGSIDSGFAGGMPYAADTMTVGGFSKVAVGTDGKIAVVGGYGANVSPGFVVERLTSTGVLDTSFADNGIFAPAALTDGGGSDVSHSILQLPNGDYAVSGAVGSTDANSGTAAIVLLDGSGKVVTSFGKSGVFVAPAPVINHTLTLDAPLALLCGGDFFYAGKELPTDGGGVGNTNDIALLHVLANGTLDTSFGGSDAGTGRAGLTTVVNVVAVAEDPTSRKPVVIATTVNNQVGVFRFEP